MTLKRWTFTSNDFFCENFKLNSQGKKSRIRETKNLSTDADRRTDTILERLRDLSRKKKRKKMGRLTRPHGHATAQRVGNGLSAPTPRF